MEPTRRVVAGLSGVGLVLIGVGIAALVFDSGLSGGGAATISHAGTTPPGPSSPPVSPRLTPSPSPSRGVGSPGVPSPSRSSSPAVSVGPTGHSIGFAQAGNGFVYYAADGTVIPVIPVPGCEVRLESGRAIYYALASNKLGLKTGSYAGEFKPLVTMGQPDGSSAETGGIVMAGPVVARMISDKLASIQTPEDKWIVALPVDIRGATSVVSVSFDQFGLAGWSNTPRVIVGFPGSLPVVEINPTNEGFHVLVEALGVTAWQVIDPKRLTLPPGVIDPAHAMNQLLIYGNGTPTIPGTSGVPRDAIYDRKAGNPFPVGQLMLSATSDVSVSLVVNGSRADLGPSKVLTVGDVPVFAAKS
jgi:hypothetical protein